MRPLPYIISVSMLLVLFGCGSRQQTISLEDEKKRWIAEGWTYLETFGRPAEDTVLVAHADSPTAREIRAFARTDGLATNKVYVQTQSLYLIVTMQRPTGDAFALVFTKPKP